MSSIKKPVTFFISLPLIFLLITPSVTGLVFLLDGTEVPGTQIPDILLNDTLTQSPAPLQFFFDYDCQSCQQALDYLRSFEKKNPDIAITHYNLAYPEENTILFTHQKSRFNTTKIHYPAVFIGDIVISGSSDIIHCMPDYVKAYHRS